MTDQTSLHYETLQLPTHIRLVELLPSENVDDDISCRVRIVNLDEAPLYEAVSYVWGSEADKAEILCDGLALQIPRNLIAAFRRFRRSRTPRLLWADSICINQVNTLEKNQQVRIMGRIFAGATTVLIWFGEAEEEDSGQVIQGLNAPIGSHSSCRLDELNQDLLAKKPRNEDGDRIYDLIELRAFVRILARSWFRRAWTFQESRLAKSRRFFLGSLEIPDNDLQFAFLTLVKLLYSAELPECSRSIVYSVNDLMQSSSMLLPSTLRHSSLRYLMSSRRGCGCKHAVDLVYSLLEVTGGDTESIVPDYNKDFPQVFAEAIMVMIRADENLAVFEDVGIVPRSMTSELPSWMPDWRIAAPDPGILRLNLHLFSCAGSTKPIISMSSNSRNLTTSGFVIDSIRELLLPQESLNSLEAQEVMGPPWIRNLCCDIDNFDLANASTKRWDQSTYDMYDAKIAHSVHSGPPTEFSAFVDRIVSHSPHKRVMTTQCERTGVAPTNAEPGDIVTVLFGGQVPVLLRPTDKRNEFLFVGQCYVDQMMDGAAMEQLANALNRALNNIIALPLKRSSDTVTDFPPSGDPNLQLYQIRDFVLV